MAANQLWILTSGDTKKFAGSLRMVISSTVSFDAEIASHNVESGSDITDNVQLKPRRVTFQTFVSNQPIDDTRMDARSIPIDLSSLPTADPPPPFTPGAIFGGLENGLKAAFTKQPSYAMNVLVADTPFDAVRETMALLEGLQRDATIVAIETPKKFYRSMLLESYQMTRGPEEGDGASFSLSFVEVRIVESKKTKAPAAERKKNDTKKSAGAQPAVEVPPDQGLESVGSRIVGGLVKLFGREAP